MNQKSFLAAIYLHPELYPPTLNAIDQFSDYADQVFVLARNVVQSDWEYPKNVKLIASGQYKPLRETEKISSFWKIFSFIRFSFSFLKLIRKHKPEWVVCYDPISLLSFRLANFLLSHRARLWYHNHDVVEIHEMNKFSVGGIAALHEHKEFKHIDIFSLPSPERVKYFPIEKLKGKYFIIPNYPSKRRNSIKEYVREYPRDELKLIYQGSISNGHGLEEIIDFMTTNHNISLTIIGSGNAEYLSTISSLIDKHKMNDRAVLENPVSYSKLGDITRKHHIGLAIHKPLNIIYSTGGMASNKIYEYMAAGLPILYYDNEHYNKYLSKYKWAFSNNLSTVILSKQTEYICSNYKELSEFALDDFETDLNFEKVFEPVLNYLQQAN